MQKQRRGFTLVELLVVISIIAILAGLAFPALTLAMDAAKKAQVASFINQIKTALTLYNTEYGTWPYSTPNPDGAVLLTTDAYTCLKGGTNSTSSGTTFPNSRQIAFMEFQSKDLDDPKNPTKFVDPWKVGGVRQDYHIMVDSTNTGQITLPFTQTTTQSPIVSAGVVVWSTGKPVSSTTANTDDTKFIKTW